MDRRQPISLKYLMVAIAIVCLILTNYVACGVYCLVGLVAFLLIAMFVVRRVLPMVIVGIAMLLLIWCVTVGDVVLHGPVTRYHNTRLENLVFSNQLIGQPSDAALEVLGSPTFKYKTQRGETWNYAPFRLFPYGKFQVHCKNDHVLSIELYDD